MVNDWMAFLKMVKKGSYLLLPLLPSIILEVLVSAINKKRKEKAYRLERNKLNLPYLQIDYDYIESPKESTKNSQ